MSLLSFLSPNKRLLSHWAKYTFLVSIHGFKKSASRIIYSSSPIITMVYLPDMIGPLGKASGLHYKNPRFPLDIKLPRKLQPGSKIHVHGATYQTAKKFALILKDDDANLLFYFNPRFYEGCVVRNSCLGEDWGAEERGGGMPFKPDQHFFITIIVTADSYEVKVNGSDFINYNHRDGMPFTNVTHLSMEGEIVIYGIHVPIAYMPAPLTRRIPVHAFLGDTYLIEGRVRNGADKFVFNVQAGEQESADILYHFNPRFKDKVLVFNNRIANSWGDEKRAETLPIGPGDKFLLCIVAGKDGFIPFLNGDPLPIFRHRAALSGACTLAIDGDVDVLKFLIDSAPVRMPPGVPDIDIDAFEETSVQALLSHTPVSLPLLGSFAPGKVVYVSGKVGYNFTWFSINLKCGATPEDDIALHVNPRYTDVDDEGVWSVLVFNSRIGGSWGKELRLPNPISPREEFDIFILGDEKSYRILFNGREVEYDFEHRVDISRVNHVSLEGPVTLYRMLAN